MTDPAPARRKRVVLVAAVLTRFPGAKIVDIQIRGGEEDLGLPPASVPVENPDEAPDSDED